MQDPDRISSRGSFSILPRYFHTMHHPRIPMQLLLVVHSNVEILFELNDLNSTLFRHVLLANVILIEISIFQKIIGLEIFGVLIRKT